MSFGTSANHSCSTTLINTTVQFGAAADVIYFSGGLFRWFNTANAVQGATLPNTLFGNNSGGRNAIAILDGVDLSALSSKTVVGNTIAPFTTFQLINCKLPGTVTVGGTPPEPGSTTDVICTDSTVVNSSSFIQTRYTYQGTLTADNTVYNGATDGVNNISWKVVTTANSNPQAPFECFEIVQWAAAGTYAASTIVATSATGSLKTNDIWVDVNYMGTSGNPLAKRATTFGAGSGTVPLPQIPAGTTPGSVATGATWGTGGAGTNYTLAIPSFTTTLAGYVRFTVKVAKASLTIWVDPKAVIA